MTCSERSEAISAHLDGELAGHEVAALETHLASCGTCRRQLDGLRALKHAVARVEGRTAPPEAVLARVEALRLRRETGWTGFRVAVAAAAVMVVAVGALFLARPSFLPYDQRSLPAELIADHLRSAPDIMPAEIASGNRLDVAAFFRTKVPFDPVVPRLGPASLVGGRVCKVEGRKVQLLFYELDGRHLSLYVSDRPAAMKSCHDDGEHSVCQRQLAGLSLILVGKGQESEMSRLLDEATL